MAFCTNCGAFVPDDSKFCENCGAPVAAPEQNDEPVRVEAEVTYQPSENTYQPVEDAYTPAPAETASPSKGFGIAALVLGILSIVFLCLSWHPVFALIDLVLSIFAIVLGAVGIRRSRDRGSRLRYRRHGALPRLPRLLGSLRSDRRLRNERPQVHV